MMIRALTAGVIYLALATAALPDSAPAPLPWTPVGQIYVTPSQARMYGPDALSEPQPWTAIYLQTHSPTPKGPQAEGTWHTVDLTPLGVGADAVAAYLSGILIITHGTATETADLHVSMRQFGSTEDPTCQKYIGQAIEAAIGGGQRSNFAAWVPLNGGKFQWCFRTGTGGVWPNNSAYGINLSLQMWAASQ